MPNSLDPDLHGRVNFLEQGFKDLRIDVKEGFAKISMTMDAMGSRMAFSGKTDWKMIAAFASLTIAAIGSFVTVTKQPIENSIATQGADIAQLKTTMAVVSTDLNKNYLRTEDWRYERDRGFNQLVERDKQLGDAVGKAADILSRLQIDQAKTQAQVDAVRK